MYSLRVLLRVSILWSWINSGFAFWWFLLNFAQTINKKIIDPLVPRYSAIGTEPSPCIMHITDAPQKPFVKSVPRHKKNPSIGNKVVTYSSDVYIEPQACLLFCALVYYRRMWLS